VPCDSTFTVTPVFPVNSGSKCPNRPESCVEVVEATTIDFSLRYRMPRQENGDAKDRDESEYGLPP
jgi:hypothetical protein